jgi:hypothetical protein
MAITITDLTNEIHTARHFAIIKQDYRGTLAGSPVNIVINRNNSAPTHIHLLTMSPTIGNHQNTDDYFITHITIDEAITIRVPRTMSASELWQRIYQIRLKTVPPPEPDWRERNRHYQRRPVIRENRPAQQRYLQRPSKHQLTNQSPRARSA